MALVHSDSPGWAMTEKIYAMQSAVGVLILINF
jgi:hypothetical protein